MSKKETFIKEVENLLVETNKNLSEDAMTYFEALKGGGDKDKPAFTDNGKLILKFIKENKDSYNNLFKAKDVGEGIGMISRAASGAMRKLVTDGYIEKIGENPTMYSLTSKGEEVIFED